MTNKVNTVREHSNTSKALLYCSLLALQFGLQPILAKQFTAPTASKESIVVATEMSKVFIAASSLYSEDESTRNNVVKSWSIKDYLQAAALPASLYAVQNMLMQTGYKYLDAMTLNLLNQTKTLSAAFFLFIIMGKRQSKVQLLALLLLLCAAVILTAPVDSNPLDMIQSLQGISVASISAKLSTIVKGDSNSKANEYAIGVITVSAASLISGISTALTQRILSRGRHAITYSAELAVFGISVLMMGDIFSNSGRSTIFDFHSEKSLQNTWTLGTWIPVLTNAFGGIIVGLVTKYAGGVTKGFALIAGILVTGLMEFLVFGIPLGSRHAIATILVCISIVLHSNFQYISSANTVVTDKIANRKKIQ
jgi:solute carrier family 35 (UDP-sugar transporter), member A1/2/3